MTSPRPQKIVVVGIGYVGLANAVLLALNNEVTAVDLSTKRIEKVERKKKCPIIDPKLEHFIPRGNLPNRSVIPLQLACLVFVCDKSFTKERLATGLITSQSGR
jgi:threonine dehydrogenase-like Zn-dependent dehydrogenase